LQAVTTSAIDKLKKHEELKATNEKAKTKFQQKWELWEKAKQKEQTSVEKVFKARVAGQNNQQRMPQRAYLKWKPKVVE